MKTRVCVWLMAAALAFVTQAEPLSADVPARIAAERQQLQQALQAVELADLERKRACWQRFAVNDCLREVRRQRYAALDPLRARELELNALERAWRTPERDERLREKSGAEERKP